MSTKAQESITAPAIGQHWPGQGGIYAGLVRGRDDQPDYHLIVGPTLPVSNWKAAISAATEIEVEGHKDFTLPFRAEQAVLFGNVPELFEKNWYWSCKEHAAVPDYAWVQDFNYGIQSLSHKSIQGRARAVRRFEKI